MMPDANDASLFAENAYLTYQLEGGILFQRFKDEVKRITFPIALVTAADRQLLTKNNPTPLLVDMNDVRFAKVKAMKYYVIPESMVDVLASAILVHRYPQYLATTFFLSISRRYTPFPVQAFLSREEAMDWLQQFVE